MEIKNGDLYSYATVDVESHGYLIRAHEDYMYEVEVHPATDWLHAEIELQIGSDGNGYSLNLKIKPEEIGMLIFDPRSRGVSRSYIFVYRSGKTKEEVAELIRPQFTEVMEQRLDAFKILVFNAQEMLDVLKSEKPVDDYLCSTSPHFEK